MRTPEKVFKKLWIKIIEDANYLESSLPKISLRGFLDGKIGGRVV